MNLCRSLKHPTHRDVELFFIPDVDPDTDEFCELLLTKADGEIPVVWGRILRHPVSGDACFDAGDPYKNEMEFMDASLMKEAIERMGEFRFYVLSDADRIEIKEKTLATLNTV